MYACSQSALHYSTVYMCAPQPVFEQTHDLAAQYQQTTELLPRGQAAACQLCCAALKVTSISCDRSSYLFDQSDCLTGKGKKGSKKKAAGKGKGSTSAAPAASKQSNKNQNQSDAAHSPYLTVHALTDKVLEWYPAMEDAGERFCA